MADQVYMDIPAVRDMSKQFTNIGEVLTNVAKAMEVLSNTLKASAFVGLVGAAALANVLDRIKPFIEDRAKKCEEIGKDLNTSVDAFERGDETGATRFY